MSTVGSELEELKPSRSWHPVTGWQTTRGWRGTKRAVQGFATRLLQQRIPLYIDDEEGGYQTIRATFGSAEDGSAADTQVIPLWTLHENLIERSILEHKNVLALGATCIEAILKAEAEIHKSLDTRKAEVAATVQTNDKKLLAASVLERMVSGVSTFFSDVQHVLRKTQVIQPYSAIKPNVAGTGLVYTQQKLQQTEGMPGNLLFTLPVGYWFKRGANVDQLSNGSWQIAEEWWHTELFDSLLYRLA